MRLLRCVWGLLVVVLLVPVLGLVVLPVERVGAWPTEVTVVAADWPLVPVGVAPGEVFRLVFITDAGVAGTSGDVATYNAKVVTEAAAGHEAIRPYADGFRALVSTGSVDAAVNVDADAGEGGAALYWLADPVLGRRVNPPSSSLSPTERAELLRGKRIAYDGWWLWQRHWDSKEGDAKGADGTTRYSNWSVWTGTDPLSGTKATVDGVAAYLGSGSPLVMRGAPHDTAVAASSSAHRLLGVSGNFVVESFDHTQAPVPPQTVAVGADWPLVPQGLGEGDSFRLAFMTDYGYSAFARDVGWYNRAVADLIRDGHNRQANSGHCWIQPYADLFRALVSTVHVDAKDNLGMDPTESGVATYWLSREFSGERPHLKVADDNAGFWNEVNLSQHADRVPDQWGGYKRRLSVFTGTDVSTGAKSDFPAGVYRYERMSFQPVTVWELEKDATTLRITTDAAQHSRRLLAVSPIFTVGAPEVSLSRYGAGVRVVTTADCRRYALYGVSGMTAQQIAQLDYITPNQIASKTRDWVHEGGRFTQRVTIDKAPTTDLDVGFQIGGTADYGDDYTISGASVSGTSGSVTIPAGQTEAAFTLHITDDDDPTDETVVITLDPDSAYKLAPDARTRTVTLRADVVVSIDAAHSQIGNNDTTKVTIRLSNPLMPSQLLTVPLSYAGSTLTRSGSTEYVLRCDSTYGYPRNCPRPVSTRQHNVLAFRNLSGGRSPTTFPMTLSTTAGLGPGTVRISLGNVVLAGAPAAVRVDTSSVTVTVGRNLPKIANAQQQRGETVVSSVVSVSADQSTVVEGDAAVFTVAAEPAPSEDLVVWVDSDETYGTGADLVGVAGLREVLIAAGETSVTYSHDTFDDEVDRGGGMLSVTVAADGYVSRSRGSATVLVVDDDVAVVFVADAVLVAEVTAKADAHTNAAAAGRLRKVAAGMLGVAGGYSAQECHDTARDHGVLAAWGAWCDEIERRETWTPTQQQTPLPEVAVTAGADVTEGSAAVFTVTADPAPASDLAVSVTVAQVGDYGATTGTHTVTVDTSGTAVLSVATIGDDVDEADGSVTVTVNTRNGYSISAVEGTASVTVADDDASALEKLKKLVQNQIDATAADGDAAANARWRRALTALKGQWSGLAADEARLYAKGHRDAGRDTQADLWEAVADHIDTVNAATTVTISAGPAVPEGTDAVFTLTASPAPPSPVSVRVIIVDRGRYAASTAARMVTVGASGTATLSIATTDDDTEKADGSITAALAYGIGYSVSRSWTKYAATVKVTDNDGDPPVPEVAVTAGADVTEGSAAVFTVTADPAPAVDLAVSVTVTAGGDYGAATGTHTVTVGTSGTAVLSVATAGDSADEADGSVTATINTADGYTVSATEGTASVTVADDDDPLPAVFVPDAALVAEVTAKADAHTNAAAAERLRKIAAGMTGTAGGYSAQECRDTARDHGVLATWGAWCDEIERREDWTPPARQQTPTPEPEPTPEVAVTAGPAVTEGAAATFTVSASPAPASELAVNVNVSASGDHGAATGSRTVTVDTSGTATLSVATTDDSVDEADGSVTATVATGSGYSVSSSNAAATVAVADDDDPPPVVSTVSISAGPAVTEGAAATFTITASPAPTGPVAVKVNIAQTGDYGATTGTRTVTVGTSGTATLAVATTGDSTDEPDGSVTATVATGGGYSVSSSRNSASVAVADDDDPPPVIPTVAVTAGAAVTEGAAATFTITASPAPAALVTVKIDIAQHGDYGATTGTRTVTVGTSGTATLAVATTGDSTEEPDGSITVTVATGGGYTVSASQNSATVAVADDDTPTPKPEPKPTPTPSQDAIASVAEALELATAELARYEALDADFDYWMLAHRTEPIIKALQGAQTAANNTNNGWYHFNNALTHAAAAKDATAITNLTRLGEFFITHYNLTIDHHNLGLAWPTQ